MKSLHKHGASASRLFSLSVVIALSGGAGTLFSGCQTPPTKQAATKPWQIDPIMRVGGTQAKGSQTGDSHYQLGRYYDGQLRPDQAIEAYRKAILLDPQHAEAHNALGVSLARKGKLTDAIALLERAASLASNKPHIVGNLGYALLLAGRNQSAITMLTSASRLDPTDNRVRNNLVMALRREGLPTGQAMAKPPVEQASNTVAALPPIEQTPPSASTSAIEVVSDMPRTAQITIVSNTQIEAVETAPQIVELRRMDTTQISPEEMPAPVATTKKGFRLEIANGLGVAGAARRVSELLRDSGLPKARTTDQRPFRHTQTLIHYAAGYEHEATRIAVLLGAATAPLPSSTKSTAAVRVVVGRDLLPVLASRSLKQPAPTTPALIAGNNPKIESGG